MSHHSLLKKEHGDAILIGASSIEHIEQNLIDLEKGPLREYLALHLYKLRCSWIFATAEEVVKALDDAWNLVSVVAANYWH